VVLVEKFLLIEVERGSLPYTPKAELDQRPGTRSAAEPGRGGLPTLYIRRDSRHGIESNAGPSDAFVQVLPLPLLIAEAAFGAARLLRLGHQPPFARFRIWLLL
jgi:hypothetical protein